MSRYWYGRLIILSLFLILLMPPEAPAKTLTVSAAEGNSLADALNAANAGDVILVGFGVYREEGLVVKNGVTLRGASEYAHWVRIESAGGMSVLNLGNAGPQTRIENLTISFRSDAVPAAVAHGAGAVLYNSAPVFENVVFTGLAADYGGAVSCSASSPTFLRCRFMHNAARAVGGAVNGTQSSLPVFEDCLFVGNTAAVGGTLNAAHGSAATLIGCTVVEGAAGVAAGLATWNAPGSSLERTILTGGSGGRGWDGDAASAPAALCTDIFGNEGGDWVGALAGLDGADGNLSADPQFCYAGNVDNPYGLNEYSPCAPAANPGCGQIGAFAVSCLFVVADAGQEDGGLPAVSRLHPNYPNPFNPRTTVRFDLAGAGHVDLAVYDVAGRLVKRLVATSLPAGTHEAFWEGRDSAGRRAAAGVYFFRLKTAETVAIHRAALVK